MERTSLYYCIGSLAVSLLIAVVAFPFAAMDLNTVNAANAPRPAYVMGSVDVGEGFGKVSVEELMTYYIENPPAVKTGATAAPEIHFGGC